MQTLGSSLQDHPSPRKDSPNSCSASVCLRPQDSSLSAMEEQSATRRPEPDEVISELSETNNKKYPENNDGDRTNESESDRHFVTTNELDDPETTTDAYFDANSTFESNNKVQRDILSRIPLMHRLIDLVYESSSTGLSGLVEKVIIDQESLGHLLNKLMPGSFRSISNINFKSLDAITVKPKGVYGSRLEIAKFLLARGIIDASVFQPLSQSDNTVALEGLRSGLYFALDPKLETEGNGVYGVFIVYWPEETTWCDNAESTVQRNRITFMRYLTQLSDQIIALVSKDQADCFVWNSNSPHLDTSAEDEDEDEDEDGRMFVFEVQKSEDQEENVVSSPGFTVDVPRNMFANQKVELIGGETSVGLLTSFLESLRANSRVHDGPMNKVTLKSILSNKKHNLCLGELDAPQLELIMNAGLRERHPNLFAAHDKDLTAAEEEFAQKMDGDKKGIEFQIREDLPRIEQAIRNIWKSYTRMFERYATTGESPSDGIPSFSGDDYPYIRALSQEYADRRLGIIRSDQFQVLKERAAIILDMFESRERTEDEQMELIQKVLDEPLDESKGLSPSRKGLKQRMKSAGSFLNNPLGGKKPDITGQAPENSVERDDINFLHVMDRAAEKNAALRGVLQKIIDILQEYLVNEEQRFVQQQSSKARDNAAQLRLARSKERIELEFEKKKQELWQDLWVNVRGAMDLEPRQTSTTRVDLIQEHDRGRRLRDFEYRVKTTEMTSHSSHKRHAFYPLKIRSADLYHQSDESFIPKPQVRWDQPAFTFKLEEHWALEFIQPMHDRCLIVVASSEKVLVFMTDLSHIDGLLTSKSPKITYDRARLGVQPVYAYDEGTRTLAISHGDEEPRLTWVEFDERFSLVRAGRTISLTGWHKTPTMKRMCFIAGSTQVCLVDQSGFARILSLDSEQFGPAHVQLEPGLGNIFSAPDGSCLFVTAGNPGTDNMELRAYHWASFGTKAEGYLPASLPSTSSYRIMAFEKYERCYMVMLSQTQPYTISSIALQVKQKLAKFDFKAQGSQSQTRRQKTVNNCLVDSHLEVWLRFPVVPAIPRNILSSALRQSRSITFVSEGNFDKAKAYFLKLIESFERTTQKPTDGKLFAITIRTLPGALSVAASELPGSHFNFGGYLVELLCLIPIQLAVTQENNFIPLKDGVLNPNFERGLLGADVPTIISSLSLGWYESLFQSYLATKPVRVVSSMGEQSVGKSYCLNHLADTSFAGSAMRTTEGVWLSCTPTKDYLLVALDFEGVQSIERSAQEDALLVLFNAAISNMVLFRNNFALSRNISSMFKSFQSSATVLDPDLNPGLFNSDLAIIIKDVIGSDKKDIVREFSEKFQSIVQEEQGLNFITRLHRGRLNIMPWPVIKSRNFYTLFSGVRDTLEKRPWTYAGGSVFLHTLKTLMAKIKANDWGALDQNLAAHRARQLTELLPNALSRGAVEIGTDSWGPLKELDNDQELQLFSDNMFWVPDSQNAAEQEATLVEQCLENLIRKYEKHSAARYETPEEGFHASLQDVLNCQFDRRVEQVQEWVSVNVRRFPQDNQDIRDLFKTLESLTLSARSAVQICSSKCSSCHFLCLRPHHHVGQHSCGTDHKCIHPCSVGEGHSSLARCGLQSGHVGRHLCEPTKHTCGQRCSLWTQGGCQIVCVKGIDHTDPSNHLCSARLHTCGQPCDLQRATQGAGKAAGPLCFGVCQTPWDQEHKRHTCASSKSCPFKCQLCPRLCSSSDHLHGLDPGSVHLCGQEHTCTNLCEMPGICQIETQPSAVIERFSGKYEQFQYTRYSQEKRRLPCAIPIAPGNLSHDGKHVHSIGSIIFHYCDIQCPHCEYYCTLPLGHPQQQHETSHGSMIKTQWLLDGPTFTASYEFQEHKYGAGDHGSTVLCSLLCSHQGRHAHVDYCRRGNDSTSACGGDEHQHIETKIRPNPNLSKDWISHRLYWARSGFKDPYSRNEQVEFSKCDSHCAGSEHQASSSSSVNPSYCAMPMFHPPVSSTASPNNGYISLDGHVFECKNPFQDHQSYHIVFVVDNSTSMTRTDHQPLQNTPITEALELHCSNRYGAVLSALYSFWKSREIPTQAPSTQSARPPRTDAYSMITFSETVTHHATNDCSSTPEQLIRSLLPHQPSFGTNFESAVNSASAIIEQNWEITRAPVLIFLSDGESSISDSLITRLCQRCIQLGMALSFYTISFGSNKYSRPLRQMAQVASQVYQTARSNQRPTRNSGKIPCEYMDVNGALELANKFLVISKSLQKPRAALIGSRNDRLSLLANEGI